ncbi:unnamed protein product [Acanthosepion pharaonis]|uniref:Aromatic-L-amino-acid decarboxylase n=1 Tax=Acanthosepion pharaonis TaxID=158019 RepID=A0A812EDI5_ACAPH|nr:unnamed protein product [Sepia pharaonis]
MNDEEFEAAGQQMLKYVIDYHKNIRERRVMPDVKPGFMRKLLPDHAPHTPEKWDLLFKDIERVIMPGVTHWRHPHFYAYYALSTSYPAILADILSDTITCSGFSWASCPSCTELEVIVMDWLVKVMDLPEAFLSTSPGHGGGVIQITR